ncbi:MAG TPA: HAD family phosphatase [Fibrobacteria bacterium]|nr:HAD family phosphatase [Fibrobacteria bacterium]HOX53102.1 HAD family phosphatase [Fibrobacteria bacterium]
MTSPIPAASQTSTAPITAVLFDLGGVLERVVAAAMVDAWSMGKVQASEFWSRWLEARSVERFESGRTDAATFAEEVIAELGLELDSEEFLEAFPSWLAGPYDGARELVMDVRRAGLQVASFSNSNEIHWPIMEAHQRAEELFHANFPSHRIGFSKPDPAAFTEVLRLWEIPAEQILFLDDNAVNVEAARKAGMRAERVQGVVGARKALAEAGFVL